jgi:hypothetical protein
VQIRRHAAPTETDLPNLSFDISDFDILDFDILSFNISDFRHFGLRHFGLRHFGLRHFGLRQKKNEVSQITGGRRFVGSTPTHTKPMIRLAGRVTRLGEFCRLLGEFPSHIGRKFTSGSSVFNFITSYTFWLLYTCTHVARLNVLSLDTKNGFGYILGDFFTN